MSIAWHKLSTGAWRADVRYAEVWANDEKMFFDDSITRHEEHAPDLASAQARALALYADWLRAELARVENAHAS